MIQYKYNTDESDRNFVIFDVGGQRAERKKWIDFFDG